MGQVVRRDDAGEPQAGLHRDAQHQGEVSIHSRAGGAQAVMAMEGERNQQTTGPGGLSVPCAGRFGKYR